MTAQEQIAKLESLLDRIRRNASKPRTAVPVMAAAAPAEPPPAAEPIAVAAIPQPVAAAPAQAPAPPPAYVEELEEPIPDIEDLDMADVEVVELAVEEGSAVSTAEDEAPDTLDEPIPESAPRPAAAMADAAEPEAPIKTPPPESGRQVVVPIAPIAPIIQDDSASEADLSGSGDVDSLLEADHSGAPLSRAPAEGGPTMEQLGATVELQGADAPAAALELDAGPIVLPAAPPADELELELPKQGFAGGYQAQLAPPSGAQADLRSLEASPPPPATESFARSVEAPLPPEQPRAAAGPIIVERPALEAHAAEVIAAAPAPKPPETFLDLLDASLALRP